MQGYWRADTADKAQLLLLTKSGTGIMRFMSWLKLVNCTVGVTVTSLERTEWEPLADSPELRLRALKDAKSAGLSTFVSIEPWIPDVTDPVAIIEASKEFVDLYMIGSFNYAGVNGDFYQQSMPEVVECRIRSGVPVYFKKELLRKVGW
jgi:DNA repair photolyase